MTRVNNYKFNTSMINLIPSEYFGSEDCKYAALLDQIYQLTKVDQHKQNTEIEEGEIEVEENEPRLVETKSEKLRENVQPGCGNISSLAEDLSLKKSSGSAKPQEVSSLPPLFPPLQFPALPPLPPHPSFYPGIPFPPLPLSYPGTLQGLPGLPGLPPPWPPLFLPSVPPPPLLSGLGLPGKPKCPPQPPPDAYLPPDEKVKRGLFLRVTSHSKSFQEFKEARGFDLKILFELDTSPGRLSWIVGYMDFMAREGEPLSLCPSMYKVWWPQMISSVYQIIFFSRRSR